VILRSQPMPAPARRSRRLGYVSWRCIRCNGCAFESPALAGDGAGDVDTHWCGRARSGVWRGGLGCR
jgi:hypothetical protein